MNLKVIRKILPEMISVYKYEYGFYLKVSTRARVDSRESLPSKCFKTIP